MKAPYLILTGALAWYAAADGGYAKDCQSMAVIQSQDNFSLRATCKAGNKSQCSILDLGKCYGTDAGILKPRDNGNLPRCRSCVLNGTSLECDCRSSSKGPHHKSSVDTNDLIVNDNGILKCFDNRADAPNDCAQKPLKSGCGNGLSLDALGYALSFYAFVLMWA
ncbi:hypothetical protein K445DRAFT_9498 [Daldinia sp. EC12]|nr:hypothetical protein K445DRAFT_9498 [Daldinia sp. EC12]